MVICRNTYVLHSLHERVARVTRWCSARNTSVLLQIRAVISSNISNLWTIILLSRVRMNEKTSYWLQFKSYFFSMFVTAFQY